VPEGDVVLRTARRLDQVFRDRPLVRAELRWGTLIGSDLVGRTTIEVVPRGKHVLHRLDSGLTIHSHLKMEGSWRIQPADRVVPERDTIRAVLGTDRWTALGSRLGMLDLVRTDEESALVGHLGPDVLGPDWDVAWAVRHLRDGHLGSAHDRIAAALLDQRNVAGIGTLWASESLWAERINPWTPMDALTDDQLTAILDRAQRLMQHASATSRPTTHIHGRSGHPCPRCRRPLRVALAGPAERERTIFYCPQCQGGLAPGDDGRTQPPLGHTRRPPARGGERRAGRR